MIAYITLDKNKQLGSGSCSKVYRGSYKKRVCAIKLIFTVDLTEEVIGRVAAEAQLLSSIQVRLNDFLVCFEFFFLFFFIIVYLASKCHSNLWCLSITTISMYFIRIM